MSKSNILSDFYESINLEPIYEEPTLTSPPELEPEPDPRSYMNNLEVSCDSTQSYSDYARQIFQTRQP